MYSNGSHHSENGFYCTDKVNFVENNPIVLIVFEVIFIIGSFFGVFYVSCVIYMNYSPCYNSF